MGKLLSSKACLMFVQVRFIMLSNTQSLQKKRTPKGLESDQGLLSQMRLYTNSIVTAEHQ